MTEMPSYKTKKQYYNSSLIFSILLSIFSYVLVFYVFEVSPSSVFKDTKILFFISNTLILIIAADFGAFSEKEKQDFYGEYTTVAATMRSCGDYYSPVPILNHNSGELAIKNPKEDELMVKEIKNPNEEESMVKEIVYVSSPKEIALEKYKAVTDHETVENKEACDASKDVNPKTYGRSKTDKPKRMKNIEGTKSKSKSYRRSESDKLKFMVVQEKWENVEEESEEFSKMSNEELNKRVEDFIQRFNRQIRLQSRILSST